MVACRKIVKTSDFVSRIEKILTEVWADEAGGAGDEDFWVGRYIWGHEIFEIRNMKYETFLAVSGEQRAVSGFYYSLRAGDLCGRVAQNFKKYEIRNLFSGERWLVSGERVLWVRFARELGKARCAECGRFNTNVVQYFTYFLTLTLTLTSTLSLTMYFLLKAAQPCPWPCISCRRQLNLDLDLNLVFPAAGSSTSTLTLTLSLTSALTLHIHRPSAANEITLMPSGRV